MKEFLPSVVVLIALICLAPACFGDDQPAVEPDVGADAADASGLTDTDIGDAQTRFEVGEPCFGPEECVEGASCIGTGEYNDYVCMTNCSQPGRICEDGSVCAPAAQGNQPTCFTAGTTPQGEPCETNLDCVSGTACFGIEGEHYCLDACHELDPDVCPEGTYCETGSSGGKGLCRSIVGAGCSSSDDCLDSVICSSEIGEEFTDLLTAGYCTQPGCSDDSECPTGSVCRTVPGTTTPICMATCASDGDCRFNQDYRCLRDSYCDEASNPEECESFRDGEDICLPVELIDGF